MYEDERKGVKNVMFSSKYDNNHLEYSFGLSMGFAEKYRIVSPSYASLSAGELAQ
jgi:hypothetical protein